MFRYIIITNSEFCFVIAWTVTHIWYINHYDSFPVLFSLLLMNSVFILFRLPGTGITSLISRMIVLVSLVGIKGYNVPRSTVTPSGV